MREIIFDVETTGLNPKQGHRIIEIGCIELLDRCTMGKYFHSYFNPDRDMPPDAFKIHGLSSEFLQDKPRFKDIADDLMAFISDAQLVAHNGSFDLGFLNHELTLINLPVVPSTRLIDTLALARQKYPRQPNKLDDLCKRIGISLKRRTKHGALLDSELLTEVYLDLIGARSSDLLLMEKPKEEIKQTEIAASKVRTVPLVSRITDADITAHHEFVASLGNAALWLEYYKGD